jgi:hypothetical protein
VEICAEKEGKYIFDVDDHISQYSVARLPGMAQLQGTSLVPSSERLDMKPPSLPAKNVSWNMCTTPSAASVECVYWRVAGHAMKPKVCSGLEGCVTSRGLEVLL